MFCLVVVVALQKCSEVGFINNSLTAKKFLFKSLQQELDVEE